MIFNCFGRLVLPILLLFFVVLNNCNAQNDCPTGPDGGPFYCAHDVNAPSPSASLPLLGRKIAIDRNLAVIGSHGLGGHPVLVVDCNTGQVVLNLDDPVASASDNGFGYSVQILDDLIVVGDQGHVQNSGTGLGQAYLFKIDRDAISYGGDGIVEQLVLSDPLFSIGPVGRFGHDVGVSENFVVVGEPDQLQISNGSVPNAGGAYLFSTEDGVFIRSFRDPSPSEGDLFGAYVAIEESEGATFVAISDHLNDDDGNNSGKVHLYSAESNEAIQSFPNGSEGDLFAEGRTGLAFGQDTDIDNGRLMVTFTGGAVCYDLTQPGSPAIFICDHEVDFVAPNMFYRSQTCSISEDYAIVGAPVQYFVGSESGKIFVYDLKANPSAGLEISPVQVLSDPTLAFNSGAPEEWPVSVAIDGQNIAAGSPLDLGPTDQIYTGQANLFRRPLLGDVNFDGVLDPLDVAGFVSHIMSGEYLLEADINLDLVIDDGDLQPFIDLFK